jgi:uncharacterized protein YndB with AHSA1/START domain
MKTQEKMSKNELMARWFAQWHNAFRRDYRSGTVQFSDFASPGRHTVVGVYADTRYIVPIQNKRVSASWALANLSKFEVNQ